MSSYATASMLVLLGGDGHRRPDQEDSMKWNSRLVTALSMMAVVFTVVPTHATSCRKNGRIVWKGFVFADFSTSAIYASDADETDVQQLTFPDAGTEDDLPKWSPDGSRIVFERGFPTGLPALVIEGMKWDGTGLHEIGDCSGNCLGNLGPDYSPSAAEIAFDKVLGTDADHATNENIWVMNADGTNPRQLTKETIDQAADVEPAWSPDGKWIAFTRQTPTAQALFLIRPDGTGLHRLTKWFINAGGADWSPDGKLIAFESYRDCCAGHVSQVYTISTEGSGTMHQLTSDGRNIEPGWSPNGKKIVFAHQPGKGPNQFADIYEMNADGTDIVTIITTDLWESEPEWGTHTEENSEFR